jgi:peptide/nickel transport system substrate-binding protein
VPVLFLRLLRFFVAFLVLVAGAGCSTRGVAPRGADALVIAQTWEPSTLNPLLHIDYNAYEIDNLVFSMLLKQDAAGRLLPDLATNVPSVANGQISPDGLRIIYHLRHGVRWQDGQPLTAADVAFSFRSIMNPQTAVPSRAGYDDVDRLETPDAYTVIVRLKRRFASILNFFFAPGQGYPVVPAHLLAAYPSLNSVPFNSLPIGSGPYKVVRWLRGERLEFAANATYFGGVPKIDRIVVRYVPNGSTIVNQLRTGEADAYFMADPSEADIAARWAIDVVRSHPVADVQLLLMNLRSDVLDDARMRRAIALSLNVPLIARAVGHGWILSRDAMRGQFLWAYDPAVRYPSFDPAAADRLLDAAGWRRGAGGLRFRAGQPLRLQLAYQSASPVNATIAILLQQEAKAHGIGITLRSYRIEQYYAPASSGGPLYGGKFQLALGDGGFSDPDVSRVYACDAAAPHGYNFARYCNPSLDELDRAALSTYNIPLRLAAYAQVQRLLARDVPSFALWQDRELDIVPRRLRGFAPNIGSPFYGVAQWSWARL